MMNALRSAGRTAHVYADRLADGAEAALERAHRLTQQGSDTVRERSHELREQALRAAAAGSYTLRQHPLRSIAIAAVAIGVTVAILSLLGSRRHR